MTLRARGANDITTRATHNTQSTRRLGHRPSRFWGDWAHKAIRFAMHDCAAKDTPDGERH